MSVTDLYSVRASAVPSVPKTIDAHMRLRALNKAHALRDYADYCNEPMLANMLRQTAEFLDEIASDERARK